MSEKILAISVFFVLLQPLYTIPSLKNNESHLTFKYIKIADVIYKVFNLKNIYMSYIIAFLQVDIPQKPHGHFKVKI